MSDDAFFKGSKNPFNIFKSFSYDLAYYRNNPDYFSPHGIWVFCGKQGSGKTLSAVLTVQKLCQDYPQALVCTNLDIRGIENEVVPFSDYTQLESISNGVKGVIFLIDEIQVVFNSLESKNIPISTMACLAQNRKDRRVIIGTSQVYGRMAKPVREQLRFAIKCRNILKYIQINQVLDPNPDGYSGENDGELQGELVRTEVWFHSPKNYESYDTLFKIKRPKKGGL